MTKDTINYERPVCKMIQFRATKICSGSLTEYNDGSADGIEEIYDL